jgi:hypothetical protein
VGGTRRANGGKEDRVHVIGGKARMKESTRKKKRKMGE